MVDHKILDDAYFYTEPGVLLCPVGCEEDYGSTLGAKSFQKLQLSLLQVLFVACRVINGWWRDLNLIFTRNVVCAV